MIDKLIMLILGLVVGGVTGFTLCAVLTISKIRDVESAGDGKQREE